jgi:hypothetical protein
LTLQRSFSFQQHNARHELEEVIVEEGLNIMKEEERPLQERDGFIMPAYGRM